MTVLDRTAIWCIDAAWVAWMVVWFIMARRVKPTTLRESVARRAVHLLPLILGAGLLFYCPPGEGWWTCRNLMHRAVWMAPTGALVVATGLALAIWARVVLAGNWSGIVTLKRNHELIRSGPYALARHPIYTGLLTAILGTAITIDQWRGVFALAIISASFLAKMRTEEAFMVRAFGEKYILYARSVSRLIPWVW